LEDGVIRFQSGYAVAAALVFLIEAGIAAWLHDPFVRPYVGDGLAVVLVYLVLRAVAPLGVFASTALALMAAGAIELGQWVGLVAILGLDQSPLARTVLGTGFDPCDFVAYAGGGIAILLGERMRRADQPSLHARRS
jgi:hypothetical protein